jgi:hypothetical protein
MTTRPIAILLAGLSALGLSACGGSGPPADTASFGPAESGPGLVADCKKPSEEPKSITIACGDGNFVITDITWDSWGDEEAGGTGTAEVNPCEPNCAESKMANYIAGVTVSDIGDCDGEPSYRKIEVDFQDEAPPGYDNPYKIDLPC